MPPPMALLAAARLLTTGESPFFFEMSGKACTSVDST